MRVCLMVEGQEGVTWAEWLALARACEEAGLDALFRSDHYVSVQRRFERSSLDAWATPPFDFSGQHYRVESLDAHPQPVQRPHPSLIVGGSGGRRSLAIAARWADGTTPSSPPPPCAGTGGPPLPGRGCSAWRTPACSG